MSNIVVVCGAPGSGKTTYVKNHLTEKDIVWDMDYIRRALCLQDDTQHEMPIATLNAAMYLRAEFLNYIQRYWLRYDHVYIITSAKPDAAGRVANGVRGELVVMPTSLDDCIKNIMNDSTRKNIGKQIDIAKEWFR